MKITGKKPPATAKPQKSVFVLVKVPEKLHRYVKSEAALMHMKLSDVILEAMEYWQQSRG